MVNVNNQLLSMGDITALMQNPSAETRAALAEKIVHSIDDASLEQKEWRLAVDIAYMLLKDNELAVRVALSDSIKNSLKAPKDLIVAIASDASDEVAEPVLRYSEILSDDDLLGIIEATQRIIRIMAVAKRKDVSPRLVSALLFKKIEEITRTVIENAGAKISEDQMVQAAEDFYDSHDIMRSFMARNPVPVKAVKHMVEVSTSVSKQKIMTNRDKAIVESDNAAASSSVADEIKLVLSLGQNPDANNCIQLAEKLNRAGSLTPIFLSSILMLGNYKLFIAGMACRSRQPIDSMEALYNGSDQQFHEFFEKTRLPYGMLKLFQYQRKSSMEIVSSGLLPNTTKFFVAASEAMSEAIEANIPYANRVGYAAQKMLSDFYETQSAKK